MSEPLFSFEGVSLHGDERPRLDDVSVAFPGRGVTAIAGPSGAGKSSLLRCCNRLEAPDAGVVRYRGADIAGRDPLAHRREVAMVFQAPVLFSGSVADNLRVADPGAGDERHQRAAPARRARRELRRTRCERAVGRRGASASAWRARSRPTRTCC